jgi:LmbE family N-acetylglucosaminyl deacetylase
VCLSAGYVSSSLPCDTRVKELNAALRCLLSSSVKYRVTIGPMRDIPRELWPIPPLVAYLDEKLAEIHKLCPIDCIVTFDSWGVSGHPHHRATHTAIRQLVSLRHGSSRNSSEVSWLSQIPIFTLQSVPLWTKYTAWLLIPCTWRLSRLSRRQLSSWGVLNGTPRRVWTAMRAHRSQFVWFRRLYLLTSQYVYVNYFQSLCGHSNSLHQSSTLCS